MISRRKLLTGAGVATGAAGLAAATRIAGRYGLMPPSSGSLYAPGEALTYAAQRLLAGDTRAREFRRDQISTQPFANTRAPEEGDYPRLQTGGFRDWRLEVGGMATKPLSLSVEELRRFPKSSQITQLTCEEGWSFIAEWAGATLRSVLEAAGVSPEAKYVVYHSIQDGWWDSLDMAEALHPQTLVNYEINGAALPPGHGGPLRLRVPRQLGYKSVKYLVRLTATDDLSRFGKGMGGSAPEYGYSWYAGI